MGRALLAGVAAIGLAAGTAQAQTRGPAQIDLSAQSMSSALNRVGRQTGTEITFAPSVVRGLRAPALRGNFTVDQALDRLLAGSGLRYRRLATGAIVVESRSGEVGAGGAAADSGSADANPLGVAEILVVGSRSQNADIARTQDDVQPYVVLDRRAIERSSASDVQTFLRETLTSAAVPLTPAQSNFGSNESTVDLRGLGPSQTLILVDGRRVAPQGRTGDAAQPDLNGIPLSAIERIEILPTTASGIYGGGATGGVVNIVLRRDYRGIEARLSNEGSFSGGGQSWRAEAGAGFSLGPDTSVLLSGSYSRTDPLLVGRRNLLARGRRQFVQNAPASIIGSGMPLLGATSNICSAVVFFPGFGNCTGASLTLDNGTPVGAGYTFVPAGYAGPSSDAGLAFLANAGRYNLDLADTDQSNGGARQSILSGSTVAAARATVRHRFNHWLDGFVEFSVSDNRGRSRASAISGTFSLAGTDPANPFQEDILITVPVLTGDRVVDSRVTNYRAVGGLIFDLPAAWRGELDYSLERTRYASRGFVVALASGSAGEVGTGTIDVFRDAGPFDLSRYAIEPQRVTPSMSKLDGVTLRLGGPIGIRLPGGRPSLSLAAEYRRERLGDFVVISPQEGFDIFQTFNSRRQTIFSLYAEAQVPIVSADNGVPAIHGLDLQLSIRRDDYSLLGSNLSTEIPGIQDPTPAARVRNEFASIDPTIGLRYQPFAGLSLRTSYGTGFLPPALNALVPDPSFIGFGFGLTDPQRGNEPIGQYEGLSGGNPNLRPERSTSWSVGAILQPRFLPGFRISADWTRIRKRDAAQRLFLTQDVLNNEELYPEGLITRGPPSGGFAVGPIIAVSVRPFNVQRQTVEALDFAASYAFEIPNIGSFELSARATRNVRNRTQIIEGAPTTELVGLIGNNKWIANGALEWRSGPWRASWATRYYSSYFLLSDHSVLPVQGSATVPSQMYHDFSVAYRSGGDIAWLEGAEIQLTARNVFNTTPPFDASFPPYYSTLGDPRLASYRIALRTAF